MLPTVFRFSNVRARLNLLLTFGLCSLAQLLALADVYPKIEASFNISNLATDPFDYALTDVRVQILQPNATTVVLPAFFDGGTTWRVRHTPILPGSYTVTGITMNGQSFAPSNLQPRTWTVSAPPSGPGYVRVDPANPNRLITS